ncbi:MAG: serine/threonine protein kinase [Lentisphaerae bacterium]|nr:serine/threonine protein kinase [Lentisphaerota bacterium]
MPDKTTPAIAYNVVRELHVGGMARLSVAVTPDGQQIVLRQLLPLYVLNLRLRRQFTNGVRIRAALSPHPLIVRSLEWGSHGVVPYELIEYIDGQSLRRLLQVKDPCVSSDPLAILRQCAEAMAHLHDRGFIHLDIKPENFLVSRLADGRLQVKLTDFDLSRESTPRKERRQSGTVAYLAPEQIRREVVGPPADVFAFGIMAYELVTGRMPFQGQHERQTRWRQTSDRFIPKPPKALKPDISPKVDRIIALCLEKDPAQRYPSMTFLCDELRKA